MIGHKPTVDREHNVIKNVKLVGMASPSHGRRYTDNALSGAVHLFEGARVNIDHWKDSTADRPLEHRFGVIREARHVPNDGNYGNLHYNPKHVLAEQILWAAEHMPETFGMSQHAFGTGRMDNGIQVVESFTSVKSVDLVADPATNRGLFDSEKLTTEVPAVEWATLTVDELKKNRNDIFESILAGPRTELDKIKLELTESKKQLDTLQVEKAMTAKREKARELIEAAKLPKDEVTLSDLFIESVVNAADEDGMKALIAERVKLVETYRGSPISHEQGQAGGAGVKLPNVKEFAAFLRS